MNEHKQYKHLNTDNTLMWECVNVFAFVNATISTFAVLISTSLPPHPHHLPQVKVFASPSTFLVRFPAVRPRARLIFEHLS